jgi:hypothetical protein
MRWHGGRMQKTPGTWNAMASLQHEFYVRSYSLLTFFVPNKNILNTFPRR